MSVRFDASSDKLERTTGNPSGAFTIMGWFKISVNRAATSVCMSLGTVAADQFYSIEATSALKLELFDGTSFPSGPTTLAVGTWYHIAMTRPTGAGQTLTAYLNGVSEANIPSSANLGTRDHLTIGDDPGSAELFNGCAAYVKIWDAALTQAEVQQEMYTVLPQMTANLHLWTPLFPGASERVVDYSGNGRNWTANGTLTDEDGPPVSYGAPVLLVGKAASAGGGPVTGTAAITLGALTLAGSGQLAIAATESTTLGALTLSATAKLAINATAATTLGTLTLSAAGQLAISATEATTLGALTLAATGSLGNAIMGAAAITLGTLTLSGTGTLASLPLTGTAAITLGALTLSSLAQVVIVGAATIQLGALTLTATEAPLVIDLTYGFVYGAAQAGGVYGAAPVASVYGVHNTGRVEGV